MKLPVALPTFRYHPDPLKTTAIVPSLGVCPVCSQARGFAYEGPFWAEEDIEGICPWCIADGRAAARFDAEFQHPHTLEAGASAAAIDELLHRTPGYTAWQTEVWPTHCGDFCAFVDYAGWTEIQPFLAELQPDLARFLAETQLSMAQLSEFLFREGDMNGYLFRCLTCRTHRLHVDFN